MSDKILGVKVWIDKNFLSTTKGSGELLTNLEKLNIQTIIEKLPVENGIFWTRKSSMSKELSNQETQHDHLVVKMDLENLIEYLHEDSLDKLISFVRKCKKSAQVTQMTLIVPGFKTFQKSLKNSDTSSLIKSKKNSKISKFELNQAVLTLELDENCCMRSYDTSEELKDLILCYTKSVSEYLSKNEGSENLIFCDKAVDKSQAKVSKDGQGLIILWKEILETFPLVSSDQAQAICSQYPSPLLLKKAFDQSTNAPMLLADIQVRRGAGVLSSVRRIGPELSQKIHKFFTSQLFNELIMIENIEFNKICTSFLIILLIYLIKKYYCKNKENLNKNDDNSVREEDFFDCQVEREKIIRDKLANVNTMEIPILKVSPKIEDDLNNEDKQKELESRRGQLDRIFELLKQQDLTNSKNDEFKFSVLKDDGSYEQQEVELKSIFDSQLRLYGL